MSSSTERGARRGGDVRADLGAARDREATIRPSTETRLLRGEASTEVVGVAMPDLRSGQWTRLGGRSILGDDVTEHLLGSLAESTRQAARAQGYSVGWAEGRRAADTEARVLAEETARQGVLAEERREAEHAAAVTALHAAAEQLHDRLGEVCRSVDEQATGLALELTRELVGRTAYDDGEHVVERVLGLLPDHPVVRVRLHPSVAAAAGDLRDRGVGVVADAGLAQADAVVEADDHVVDLRVQTALTRLAEVLK